MNIIPYAGQEKGARPDWGASALKSPAALRSAKARAEARDGVFMSLWREGFDTQAIAGKTSWPESLVANRIAAIRDRSFVA